MKLTTQCSSGKYIDTNGASSCDSCAAGQFTSSTNQTMCSFCPPGRYQPATGQPSCIDCEAGENLILSTRLFFVRVSKFIVGGKKGNLRIIFMSGKYINASASLSCDSCAAGQFAAESSQSLCSACPLGHYSAAGQISCENCEAGKIRTTNIKVLFLLLHNIKFGF